MKVRTTTLIAITVAISIPAACGGDDSAGPQDTITGSSTDAEPLASTTVGSEEVDTTGAVGQPDPSVTTAQPSTSETERPRDTLPEWAVPASLTSGLFAAGSPICLDLIDASEPLEGTSIVVISAHGRGSTAGRPEVDRGTVLHLCLFGFDETVPVEVVVTLPDGRSESRRRVESGAFDRVSAWGSDEVFRLIGRSEPLGAWSVSATQPDRSAVVDFEVVELPSVTVVPLSMLDTFFVSFPQVPPGELHRVLFTGLEPNRRIRAALFEGQHQEMSLSRSLEIAIAADGGAEVSLPTITEARDVWRCLLLEPDVADTIEPNPPSTSDLCWDPFTTVAATSAILAITCDGLGCYDVESARDPGWGVVDIAPDDPDGGLNLRSTPDQESDNIVAVLAFDAENIAVTAQEGFWLAVEVGGWVDDRSLEPDPGIACPAGLMAFRVQATGQSPDASGLVVREWSDADSAQIAALGPGLEICGAENTYGEERRQIRITGWVGSRYLTELETS